MARMPVPNLLGRGTSVRLRAPSLIPRSGTNLIHRVDAKSQGSPVPAPALSLESPGRVKGPSHRSAGALAMEEGVAAGLSLSDSPKFCQQTVI
jgi:hypothetical protein